MKEIKSHQRGVPLFSKINVDTWIKKYGISIDEGDVEWNFLNLNWKFFFDVDEEQKESEFTSHLPIEVGVDR